jgi:hypothetical protein
MRSRWFGDSASLHDVLGASLSDRILVLSSESVLKCANSSFPNDLFQLVERVLRLYALRDSAPPIAVLVSVVGSKGIRLGVDSFTRLTSGLRPLDRDVALLPEVVLDEFKPAAEIPKALRPVIDGLWQAFGAGRCHHFTDVGEWAPRR